MAAALAFLVLFGILRYKMTFSVADSGYIGWLFTARAVVIALISTAAILLAVLVTVGTAIYKRDKRIAAEQAKEAESAVAKKDDGELPAIDAKMLEPYFTAKYKGIGSNYKQFEFLGAIFKVWLQNGRKETPEELLAIMERIVQG